MRIFGLQTPELLVILAIVLLLFGPKNLPKLGASLGKTVKSLRDGMGSKVEDDNDVVEVVEDEVVEEEAAPKTRTVKRTVKAKKDAE